MTTLHGRLDIADLQPLYDEFREMPVVSISDAQRAPLPQANWQGTVYHGLPANLLRFERSRRATIWRSSAGSRRRSASIAPSRSRGARACRFASPPRSTTPISAYFDEEIAPLFELPFVEYVGEIGDAEKAGLLGGARALLFPDRLA